METALRNWGTTGPGTEVATLIHLRPPEWTTSGSDLDHRAIAELGEECFFPVANDPRNRPLLPEAVEHRGVLQSRVDLPPGRRMSYSGPSCSQTLSSRVKCCCRKNVLEKELLLQSFLSARRKQQSACPMCRNARDQVGKAFFPCPYPPRRIRWRRSAIADSTALRHLHLSRAKFVLGMPFGEQSMLGKELTRAGRAGLNGHRDSSILTYRRVRQLTSKAAGRVIAASRRSLRPSVSRRKWSAVRWSATPAWRCRRPTAAGE